VKARISRKNQKKLQFRVFFYPKRVGWFTIFGTGLPVIPTSKLVIATDYRFSSSHFRKLNFGPIFVIIGQTGGDQFQNQNRYFNP
jgi:hypothetical protein